MYTYCCLPATMCSGVLSQVLWYPEPVCCAPLALTVLAFCCTVYAVPIAAQPTSGPHTVAWQTQSNQPPQQLQTGMLHAAGLGADPSHLQAQTGHPRLPPAYTAGTPSTYPTMQPTAHPAMQPSPFMTAANPFMHPAMLYGHPGYPGALPTSPMVPGAGFPGMPHPPPWAAPGAMPEGFPGVPPGWPGMLPPGLGWGLGLPWPLAGLLRDGCSSRASDGACSSSSSGGSGPGQSKEAAGGGGGG